MLLATIPAILYIDKIGRRPALTIGAIGMGGKYSSTSSLKRILTMSQSATLSSL
jgi:hypothetical protein